MENGNLICINIPLVNQVVKQCMQCRKIKALERGALVTIGEMTKSANSRLRPKVEQHGKLLSLISSVCV